MWRLGVVPLFVLLLTACDNGGQQASAGPSVAAEPPLTMRAAILQSEGWLAPHGTFPEAPGTQACHLPHGGDYLSVSVVIPGMCQTAATQRSSGDWLVTLSQTWEARDFGLPGAMGERWHVWNFLARRGQVIGTLLSQSGDYPPEYGI